MTKAAHYTGFAGFRRLYQFHALNQKSVGRKAAALLGKSYEEVKLVVCHLGGGVSVAAHDRGRIVDVFNVKDEGAMGLDRGGGLPVNALIDYCFSGRSREEVKKTMGCRAGMLSYVGATDFRVIRDRGVLVIMCSALCGYHIHHPGPRPSYPQTPACAPPGQWRGGGRCAGDTRRPPSGDPDGNR